VAVVDRSAVQRGTLAVPPEAVLLDDGGRRAQWGGCGGRVSGASYSTTFSSLFGVPSLGLEILSAVAPSVSACATSAGLASWWPLR
jgi:hypothetical protein